MWKKKKKKSNSRNTIPPDYIITGEKISVSRTRTLHRRNNNSRLASIEAGLHRISQGVRCDSSDCRIYRLLKGHPNIRRHYIGQHPSRDSSFEYVSAKPAAMRGKGGVARHQQFHFGTPTTSFRLTSIHTRTRITATANVARCKRSDLARPKRIPTMTPARTPVRPVSKFQTYKTTIKIYTLHICIRRQCDRDRRLTTINTAPASSIRNLFSRLHFRVVSFLFLFFFLSFFPSFRCVYEEHPHHVN